jgi:hypothetical protein
MDVKHLQFKHPFTGVVSEPTGSGKTVLMREILKNNGTTFYNIRCKPKVLWAYGQWQDSYNNLIENVTLKYFEGLPSEDELKDMKPDIIIVDDLMAELSGEVRLSNLFTKGSHHMNISVFFIVQNLFHKGKEMRTVNLNTHYYIILKNPRDKLQVMALGRQIYPGKANYFLESYENATLEPYGYLCIDLKGDTPENVRLRTDITKAIKGYPNPTVYIPK